MTRQEYLDGLRMGDEVAVDYHTGGRGCKVFRVQAISQSTSQPRTFVVHGISFSRRGEHVDDSGVDTWPGPCCLEDPDGEVLGRGPQLTRRQSSERWHAAETLRKLAACLDDLPTDKLVAMVRAVLPGYEPRW